MDQMMPILEAIETASSSGLSLMKAFFLPSGRTRVFTERGTTLKMSLKAFFIWTLFERLCTIKDKVFLSVIDLLAF